MYNLKTNCQLNTRYASFPPICMAQVGPVQCAITSVFIFRAAHTTDPCWTPFCCGTVVLLGWSYRLVTVRCLGLTPSAHRESSWWGKGSLSVHQTIKQHAESHWSVLHSGNEAKEHRITATRFFLLTWLCVNGPLIHSLLMFVLRITDSIYLPVCSQQVHLICVCGSCLS